MATPVQRVIILGAAGRDFHDFNVYWRQRPDVAVVAFTAAQIPDIDGRVYPAALAGPRYPQGIPIHAEEELSALIRRYDADLVALAYSDLPYEAVMQKVALIKAAGAAFTILGHRQTTLRSVRPVIAVCAARTGCGKSQTTRAVTRILTAAGCRVAVVRHPMPYGDLAAQACQRFADFADLDRHQCTIEEREEYEPHLAAGTVVFAGVDYARILAAAEAEADVILWDGGNNDTAFYDADLYITVLDPLRPGHERRYYPGETNLYLADVLVLNKLDSASPADVTIVRANITACNPRATVIDARSPVQLDHPEIVRGARVLVVEDGPTLTHGEMQIGAGYVAAQRAGAREIVDPRPYAIGSLRSTFERYPHVQKVLPAMGYGTDQIRDLAATIAAVPCDAVVIGTPIDLGRLMRIAQPVTRATYELEECRAGQLQEAVEQVLATTLRSG
ncbi:MAG: GTPase [Phycisphaerales bacterium]|nr:GTPase [Phycisphaerales bacterium]